MVSGLAESRVLMDLLNYGSESESDEGTKDAPRSFSILESEPLEGDAEEEEIGAGLDESSRELLVAEEKEEDPKGKESASLKARASPEEDSLFVDGCDGRKKRLSK